MSASVAPFLVFFAGAALVAVLDGRTRSAVVVLVPVLGGLNLLSLDVGTVVTTSFLGYELMPVRVDRLSLLFGYVFHIAAFIAGVFALHVRERGQHVAGMLYAGSALGAVFAGDLLTLFVFWELLALTSVFLIWARGTERATADIL